MSVKPILFNGEMVRAILEGRKTVTRRLIRPRYKPDECGFQVVTRCDTGERIYVEKYDEWEVGFENPRYVNPPYQVGDTLYVRETWRPYKDGYLYKATCNDDWDGLWKPSIHMPKDAARIWLRVKEVRIEKLQEITKKQAGAEGVSYETDNSGLMRISQFIKLWNSTLAADDLEEYGWKANPWVWVIEFERCEKPGVRNEIT